MNQSRKKVPPATSHPSPARTSRCGSPSASAQRTASSTTTAYDGAITFVGSSRVLQSTTARATPIGDRKSTNASAGDQPTRAAARPATAAVASAVFQRSPGVAARSAYSSLGSSGSSVAEASAETSAETSAEPPAGSMTTGATGSGSG